MWRGTYLDRAKDPQNQRLQYHQGRRADTEGKVDADVLANVGVAARLAVDLGPILEPDASRYSIRVSAPMFRLSARRTCVTFELFTVRSRRRIASRACLVIPPTSGRIREHDLPICAVCAPASIVRYTRTAARLLVLAYSMYTSHLTLPCSENSLLCFDLSLS